MKDNMRAHAVGKDLEFCKVVLQREDRSGLAFFSSRDFPDLFLALSDKVADVEVRQAIAYGLNGAIGNAEREVNVYTNGSLLGPEISAVVTISR